MNQNMLMLLGGMMKAGRGIGRGYGEGSMIGAVGGAVPIIHLVLSLITWAAVVAVLIALARLLWKKGNKVK